MRRLITSATLGLLALWVQGALATILHPPYCPDLGLLVVLSIGFRWRGLAVGLCLATALGFAADLFSGSLMGQHALLRLFSFVAAFFAGRQLNLKGALPVMAFTLTLSLVYGLSLFAVSTFFIGGSELSWRWAVDLVLHAAVNGIAAPAVLAVVTRASAWGREEGAATRLLHIDPQRRMT